MNSLRAADQAKVSYRQIDYWIRVGYIKSSCPGSGYQRDIPGHEVEVLKCMGDLVRAGFATDVAARLAREFVADSATEIRVGNFQLRRLARESA